MEEKIICNECGKEINPAEIREDGLPAAIGFMKEDEEVVIMCAECLIELGKKLDVGAQDSNSPVS